ncbi:RNA-dependent RNA polymerase [Pleurostoma richardsiae]|uniref:RNA-dependent RNA polymerase n=1 Tax=Pleurostoma richardsiae TaxID=41990 RepID=A0AA38VCJ3_9PEZI|nr:RNA-dependent RNA polymerase [Pleurostoma richardsiae]
MEVFLRNLPTDLSEEGLRIHLEPLLKPLGIKDYLCEKAKKRRVAQITFLRLNDGQSFLSRHGETLEPPENRGRRALRNPRNTARLRITNQDVYCKPSNRHGAEGQPNPLTIRSLMHAAEERQIRHDDPEVDNPTIMFDMDSFSCGSCAFDNNQRLTYTPRVSWHSRGSIKFARRSVIVKQERSMIRIRMNSIVQLIWSKDGSLTLTLSTVPYFFLDDPEEDDLMIQIQTLCLSPGHRFPGRAEISRRRLCSLDESHATVVGHCLVYQFRVKSPELDSRMKNLAKKKTIPVEYYPLITQSMPLQRSIISIEALQKRLARCTQENLLPFSILFQLQALACNGYLHPAVVIDLTIALQNLYLADRAAGKRPISVDAMKRLFNTIDWPRPNGDASEFSVDSLIRRLRKIEDAIDGDFALQDGLFPAPTHLARINRIVVSPSRITLHGPELEAQNRVLRKFPECHDYFIRVQFCDEAGQDLQYNPRVTYDDVYARFKKILKEGVQVADENEILVTMIPDVTCGSRVFSDGIGSMSPGAMKRCRDYIPPNNPSLSCFQIRCGGAKGMLAVDSRLEGLQICIRKSMEKFITEDMHALGICDMASKPIPLVLNRQMIKILEDMGVSENWFLSLQNLELSRLKDITRSAYNVAGFLETQHIGSAIKLHRLFRECDFLGLDYRKDKFLRSVVQAAVLRELRLLKHKARIPVREGMTLFGVMDETGYLEEGQVYVTFDEQSGKHAPAPPDMQRMLVTRSPALHPGDVQEVVNTIPPNTHPLRSHYNCIVFSRNGQRDLPSKLSGGDLDGDLYNIIWDPDARPYVTFPPADYPRVPPKDIGRKVEKGDMAEFFVDFMKTDQLGVIATRHMILADQREMGTRDPDCVKLAELHSTAVDFSKTGIPVDLNTLPRADRSRPDFLAPGPHTVIHDKSEVQLQEQKILKSDDMDDNDDVAPPFQYYKSEKILGKLYRAIDEGKVWDQDVQRKPVAGGTPFWDDFIASIQTRCTAIANLDWRFRVEEAMRIRFVYEEAIFTVMKDFSEHPTDHISELEVFIGSVMSKTGIQTRRQLDRSLKLRDEFERIASWITRQMRPCYVGYPREGSGAETDALELCLACMIIGCQPNDSNKDSRRQRNGHGKLESFKAVAAAAFLRELELPERGSYGKVQAMSQSLV